jgi:hypothetical protein
MSRTRHHGSTTAPDRTKRKKVQSLKQRYVKAFRIDEWYIELPVTKGISRRLGGRDQIWS